MLIPPRCCYLNNHQDLPTSAMSNSKHHNVLVKLTMLHIAGCHIQLGNVKKMLANYVSYPLGYGKYKEGEGTFPPKPKYQVINQINGHKDIFPYPQIVAIHPGWNTSKLHIRGLVSPHLQHHNIRTWRNEQSNLILNPEALGMYVFASLAEAS